MIVRDRAEEVSEEIANIESRQLLGLMRAFQTLLDKIEINDLSDQTELLINVINQLTTFHTNFCKILNNIKNDNTFEGYPSLRKFFRNSYQNFTAFLDNHYTEYMRPAQSEIESVLKFADSCQQKSNGMTKYLKIMNSALSQIFILHIPVLNVSDLIKKTEKEKSEILNHYERKYQTFNSEIIQKFIFYFTPDRVKRECEFVNKISGVEVVYGPEDFPGRFRTVLEFIKSNADFFLLPLTGDDFFQNWAQAHARLLQPLSDGLKKYLDTPIELTLLEKVLVEYLGSDKKNDGQLIKFLKKPDYSNTGDLIPFLYTMIQSGAATKITHKWKKDKTGKCFEQYKTLLFIKKLILAEIQFLKTLLRTLKIVASMNISLNQLYKLDSIIDVLLLKYDLLEENNEQVNRYEKNFVNILSAYHQQRKTFKNILFQLADILDENLENHLAKFYGEIEATLALAQLWLIDNNQLSETITDKLALLKKLVIPFVRQLSSKGFVFVEPSDISKILFSEYQTIIDDARQKYVDKLQDELNLVIIKKIYLQFYPEVVKNDLIAINEAIGNTFLKEPLFYSGTFITVLEFIKENHDFFIAPLNDSLWFQQWAKKNKPLLTPLSSCLKDHAGTDDQLSCFKKALANYANYGDDGDLIYFLSHLNFAKKNNLIDSLEIIILDGSAPTAVQKWRNDKTGHPYKTHESLLAVSAQHANLLSITNVFPDKLKIDEPFYLVEDLSEKIDALKFQINSINLANADDNDLMNLDKILSECTQINYSIQTKLSFYICNIDCAIAQSLKKYMAKIELAIKDAKVCSIYDISLDSDNRLSLLIHYLENLLMPLTEQFNLKYKHDTSFDYANSMLEDKAAGVQTKINEYSEILDSFLESIKDKIKFMYDQNILETKISEVYSLISHRKKVPHTFSIYSVPFPAKKHFLDENNKSETYEGKSAKPGM